MPRMLCQRTHVVAGEHREPPRIGGIAGVARPLRHVTERRAELVLPEQAAREPDRRGEQCGVAVAR